MQLNLSTTPEIIEFAPAFFVYLEKRGSFPKQAPLAWQEFRAITLNTVKYATQDMAGMGHIDSTVQGDDACIYQAGILLNEKLKDIPAGLQMRILNAQRYAGFVYIGAYSQLAQVYPKIFMMLGKANFNIRNDFSMERYRNTPMDTPEEKLETEILIPVG